MNNPQAVLNAEGQPNENNDTDRFLGRGARESIHGYVCHLNLGTLLYLRAFIKKCTFKLALEVGEIKCFDDVVFEYKTENGETVRLFIQAKHIQEINKGKDSKKCITSTHLLLGKNCVGQNEDRFKIETYFSGYLKNKKLSHFKADKEHFVIYTNADINLTDFVEIEAHQLLPVETDPFLQIREECATNCYQFAIKKHQEEKENDFYRKLKQLTDSYILAEKLVSCIKNKKKLELDNDVIKHYKDTLSTLVLVQKKNDKNNEYIRTFSESFINCEITSHENAENFRNTFKMIYYEKVMKPRNLPDTDDAFKNDIKEKKITVSRRFLESNETLLEFPKNPNEDIKQFFDEFILAVNQPNEAELEEYIKKYMEQIFNLKDIEFVTTTIKGDMLNEIKSREGVWLKWEDANIFKKQMELKMELLMIKGIGQEYENKLKQMAVYMKAEELNDDITARSLTEFLTTRTEDQDKKIMTLVTRKSIFSLLKICQTIEILKSRGDFTSLMKKDNLLFLSLAKLASVASVKDVFNNDQTSNIFVVYVNDENEIETNEITLLNNLKQLFQVVITLNKKIILILKESNVENIFSVIDELQYEQHLFRDREAIFDTPLQFLQLEEATQNNLLRLSRVNLQGTETNLLSMAVVDPREIKQIIDEDTLSLLVQNIPISIGKIIKDFDFDYVPRQLTVETNEEPGPSEPISISEDDLIMNQETGEVLIVSGDMNTGKSALVTSLSKKLKDKNKNMWVLRLDLNIYPTFNNALLYITDEEQDRFHEDVNRAVEFLIEKLLGGKEETKLVTPFEKELLKLGFQGHIRLTLFVDGINTVFREYKQLVYRLLEALKSTQLRLLLITTRPTEEQQLIEELEGICFKLTPLPEAQGDVDQVTLTWTGRVPTQDALNNMLQRALNKISEHERLLSNDKGENFNMLHSCCKQILKDAPSIIDRLVKKHLDVSLEGTYKRK